jgi:uncharacterized protein YcfJ
MKDTILNTEPSYLAAQETLFSATLARETLLLRGCQIGIVISGLLLILIGIGVHAAVIGVWGAISGLIYENKRRRRGEGDSVVAILLPIAGALSGTFVLLNQQSLF